MLELTDTDHDAELCGLPVVPRSRSVPVGRMGGRREVDDEDPHSMGRSQVVTVNEVKKSILNKVNGVCECGSVRANYINKT